MIEELLKKFGLEWDDLDTPGHSGEKETLLKMAAEARKGVITIEGLRTHVKNMKEAVELELTQRDNTFFGWFLGWRNDYALKARLKNYIILENFLSTPENIKKNMEDMIVGMVGRGMK